MSQLALAVGMVVMAGNVMAQTDASADATGTATIIAPITLTNNTDLAFGNVVADKNTAGTVVLTAASSPTRTPTDVLLPATGGVVTAAKFTVGGAVDFAYTVTLPTSATLESGENEMTVDTFTSSVTNQQGTISATPANNEFYVGATLNVGSAQAAGDYSGTFAVTVAYD